MSAGLCGFSIIKGAGQLVLPDAKLTTFAEVEFGFRYVLRPSLLSLTCRCRHAEFPFIIFFISFVNICISGLTFADAAAHPVCFAPHRLLPILLGQIPWCNTCERDKKCSTIPTVHTPASHSFHLRKTEIKQMAFMSA